MNMIVRLFLLIVLMSGFLASAQAQQDPVGKIVKDIEAAKQRTRAAVTGQPATNTTGNPIVSLLSKPMQDLANFISNGFDQADQLSTAVPELQDGNGQSCWRTLKNYSGVLKAHPIPITLHASADLESIRLLNIAANKICQNAACTQVFTEAGNLINSAMPLDIPLPNLTALCSKVPEIAVVAPVQPITPLIDPTPSPSPTPSASPTP